MTEKTVGYDTWYDYVSCSAEFSFCPTLVLQNPLQISYDSIDYPEGT